MVADTPRWWRRFATVRARTTAAATIIAGVALVIAAITLLVLLKRSLREHVDDVAEARAVDVAALAREGPLPATLAAGAEDAALVQVVDDATGRVIASSPALSGAPPMTNFRPPETDVAIRSIDGIDGYSGSKFRAVALRAESEGKPLTIYVAASLEPVDEPLEILARALVVGVPALVALIAITAWFVVGRALRPIDAIRAEVADISDRSLDRRVPVPPTHDEVSRLADTMNAMLDRLDAAAQRQRRFVADASHELQTPLASARTDLEVALAHPNRTEWGETATDLLTANRRMEGLVRDLLFLARTDDNAAARLPLVPVDLDDIVLSEAASLRGGARVPVDTSRVSAAAIAGRRDDLARAVRNLLDNADRYAANAVVVELTMNGDDVTLTVADDGPGIPPADRVRVFERFTRLDDARTRETGGSGLGLAIAREIVVAHGGTITIDGADAGARLVVRFPAA